MADLFDTPELIPQNISSILETFNEETDNTYTELARLCGEIEKQGYSFESGLDAVPFNLHKINK